MNCRICESECSMFLDLGRQPTANNFLMPDQFENETFYQLEVYFCPGCFTVQLGECPDVSEVFNENYAFFTGTSARMVKHFADLAALIKEKYLPQNGLIIEVGSNDGTFLQNFRNERHIGYDPAKSVSDIALSKGLNISVTPFDNGAFLNNAVDVIVSANVFAHIPDRRRVLKNIKGALASGGVWINEEPYIGNIIDNLAYDQFYNEHVFYSSIASMYSALSFCGLDIIDFEFTWTHGGSIRYFIGHETPGRYLDTKEKVRHQEWAESLNSFDVFETFGTNVEFHAKAFVQDLADLGKPVPGYGATAKSSTVLNYCQIGTDIIDRIYDTTPAKQGKFSPGMHIPIVPYDDFKKDDPKDVVLFAWNHAKEIFAKESGVERNWILPIGEI